MIRNENGLLTGYVYVDVAGRDPESYVSEANQLLRDHLKLRTKFLRARDRFDRVKRWVQPADTADELDRKMIAGKFFI